MLKKILIITALLLILAGIYYYYTRLFLSNQKNINELIELAPSNSAVILNTYSLEKLATLLEGNRIWQDLVKNGLAKQLDTQYNFITSFLKSDSKLQSITQNPFMLTINKSGKDNATFIYYFKLENIFANDKATYKYLKTKLTSAYTTSERKYNGYNILKITHDKKTYHLLVVSNVAILTTNGVLIERIARGINTGYSILNEDKNLKKAVSTAGKNVVANLYVNYPAFFDIASNLLVKNYKYAVKKLKTASWTEFDVTLKKNNISLNGFTIAPASVPQYFDIFKKQKPVKNNMEEIIPSSVVSFIMIGISSPQQFKSDYENYLKQNSWYKDYEKNLDQYNKLLKIKVDSLFYSILDNEIGLVKLTPQSSDIEQSTFLVAKTVSKRLATQEMLKIIKSHADHYGNKQDEYISYFNIDEETKIPVYSFPIHYFGKLLFGDIFGKVETSFFTFADNYIIFGNNKKELKRFILDNIHRHTLETDMEYNDFKETLSNKSNFYFFSKITSAYPIVETYLKPKLADKFKKQKDAYDKIYGIGLQIQGGDKLLYTSLSTYYNPNTREKPHTVWETLLDTTITFKPQLVINHNTNKKEIILQDEKNNLYLINSAGRILWKLHLPEKIIGKIYQIDYYKNNKLQYLFNTRTKMYVIDRNGNYVEHYPITLRSPATNQLALFDYDNTKDYRIFIAGKDKHIYLYSKEGNVIPGWKFGKTDAPVYQRIQHFKIGDKDYIVFADSLKTYILNRRGEDRVKVKKFFSKSRNSIFYLDKINDKFYLITTDNKGTIYYIDFDGNVTEKQIKIFSPSHYFKMLDIDRDGNKDYIFADKNNFIVFDKNGKTKFEYEFENPVYFPPIIFNFPNNVVKLGIVDRTSSLVYLFNSDGSIYNDFPLEGNSPFTIGHFNENSVKFNLIVGSNDNFLYNYEVN